MELHVEAAGVANGLALRVPAPQGGGRGVAVGTGQAQPPGRGLEASIGKHRRKQRREQMIYVFTVHKKYFKTQRER